MAEVKVLVAGDFCPVAGFEKGIANNAVLGSNVAGSIQELTQDSDCFIVNLECPLTGRADRVDKVGPHLRATPKAAAFLADLGVNLVTLANNHIRDAGQMGVVETLQACKAAGVDTVGAGVNPSEAARIHFMTRKGRILAVINMAEQEFNCANSSRGGANPFDIISAIEAVREARKHAHHVLLILHGGLESAHYPSPVSVRTLRYLAEQGLTAIIRHHPHVVQGHEVWKGVPIFYSLGNFIFNWHTPVMDKGWYEGILVALSFDEGDRCSFTIYPFEQCKDTPGIEMMKGAQKVHFMSQYEAWCKTIEDGAALQREWRDTLEQRENTYWSSLVLPHSLLIRIARRLGLLKYFRPPRMRRAILENYLRCDAHREALLCILEREVKL